MRPKNIITVRAHRAVFLLAIVTAFMQIGAWKGQSKPGELPPLPTAPSTRPALPADLNQASLRVSAIDELYQLDLSADQMRAFRTAATGSANPNVKAAGEDDSKLLDAYRALYIAILSGDEDEDITKLRNHVNQAESASSVEVDDEVHATVAARSHADALLNLLTASQIAAYVGSQSDGVSDPIERMMSAIFDPDDEADDPKDIGNEVAWLAAGADAVKAGPIAANVQAWIESNRKLNKSVLELRKAELETSAKKIVGSVPPMDVLHHWLENSIAELLSNPQLPPAIEAMTAARHTAR